MITSNIQLYELLKEEMGSLEAKTLVEFVQQEVEHQVEHKKEGLATKEDIADVRLSIFNLKAELTRTIYANTLIQFFSLIAALLAILKFTH